MATLGDIQTNVSAYLQDPDHTAVSLSSVTNSINKAINYWKNKRFWFNEKTDVVTLTQGNAQITTPADFYIPSLNDGAFVIEYSGIRYPLAKLSELDYNAAYLSNGIGQPFWYSKQSNLGYMVYPIPDRNYATRCFYLKEYAALVNPSDTNDWTEDVQDLIEYTAAAYASRDYRQDMPMYSAFWSEAQIQYTSALNRTRKENATGSLSVGMLGSGNSGIL